MSPGHARATHRRGWAGAERTMLAHWRAYGWPPALACSCMCALVNPGAATPYMKSGFTQTRLKSRAARSARAMPTWSTSDQSISACSLL